MKKLIAFLLAAAMPLSLAACGSSSYNSDSDSEDRIDSDEYSFEDYLEDNDPDAYDSYQDLERGWDSGTWDSENGFFQNSDSEDRIDSDEYSFEDYLKDNDPDAYDSYQDLERGWDSGTWDSENGFFQ